MDLAGQPRPLVDDTGAVLRHGQLGTSAAPAAGQNLSFTDSSISPAVQQSWAEVPGVVRSEPIAISMSRANADQRTSGVAVFAVAPGSELAPKVGDGRAVLSVRAADSLGVSTGDRVTLAGHSMTVAAVSGEDEFSHAPVVWVAPADAPASGFAVGSLAGSAVPFVLDLPTLLFPAVVMIVLGLAGATVSLRTVTTVDPLTALGSAR